MIFHEPGTDMPREVVSGQYIFPMALEAVVSDTKDAIDRLWARPVEKIGKIERHRNVGANSWVVGGTRIRVSSIRRLSEDGYTPAQIIGEYPTITEADIRAALDHDGGAAAA